MIVDEGARIEIESEKSNRFSINLLVVQNFIQILLRDTSKTPRSAVTLLTIYQRKEHEKRSQSEDVIRDRVLVDLY